MNVWLDFFRKNQNLILFGFMLTLFSGFGQSFLISLYVPQILQEFGLRNASFGSIYAFATVLSAICLPWLGRYIDQIDLRRFSWLVIAGMVISLLIFSQANHLIWVILGLWGMRMFGQGLMSHTAVSSMARYFDKTRGKAISIASLGHPAGSAVLPLLVALGIEYLSWRWSLVIAALTLGIVLPPLLSYLLRQVNTDPKTFRSPEAKGKQTGSTAADTKEKASYKSILSSRAFWIIAPSAIALPLLNTVFFLYQIPLGASKGWSAEWVAGSLTAYAISSAVCTLIAGQWIDRLSAARLFPFYLIPLLGALLLVINFDSRWITPAYLSLMGISTGFGNPIKSALQAELFGVQFIGTVRSLFTALMVVSTALGPAVFGIFLDAGLSYEQGFSIAAIFLVLTILWSFRIVSKTRMLRWYLNLKQ